MKLRNIILLAAVLATVPFLLTLFFSGEEPVEPREVTAIEPLSKKEESPDDPEEEEAGDLAAAPEKEQTETPPAETAPGEMPEEKKEEANEESSPVAGVDTKEAPATAEGAEKALPPPPPAEPDGKPMTIGVVKDKAKLDPELAELAKNGVLAISNQDWKKAQEVYLALVKKAPDNALAYANLGVAEHQLGNHLAAAGNLQKSLDINPGIAQNWQTLGVIHFERGELEMAISALTRAIHEDPSNARSRLYLSAVIREYGWTDAAITELERAIETDPQLGEAHYNLAVTYLDEKPPRIELARRHYYTALRLGADPSEELEQIFKPRATPVPPE